MKISDDMKLDKRLVERNIQQGVLTRDDFNKHIEGLKDSHEAAAPLVVEMTDVGVADVEAIDTGEQE